MCDNSKPKARAKKVNLPDAPEPTKAVSVDIKGGARSSATIKRMKLIEQLKQQKRIAKGVKGHE